VGAVGETFRTVWLGKEAQAMVRQARVRSAERVRPMEHHLRRMAACGRLPFVIQKVFPEAMFHAPDSR